MSAREEILDRIRRRIPGGGDGPGKTPDIPVPQYVEGTASDLEERFVEMLESVHGTWEKLDSMGDVPAAAEKYMDREGFGNAVVISPDPVLSGLDWRGLSSSFRAADKEDRVSVTLAFAGLSETGTVVMVSSEGSPVSLNFLPEVNIVVLRKSRLLPAMEDLWPRIDRQPRALNFITGPSKTADIEQTIVYGAHGPRFFHVLLVADGEESATGC